MELPLKIAFCEDRAEDSALLLTLIENSGIPALCDAFSSGEELLGTFLPGRYDLIFLDIYMDGIPGVEAASKIRKADRTVILAFTTSSLEHTLESYRLGALKYLEKPLTATAVRETLELAIIKRRSSAYISLMIGGKNTEISLDSILYFEQKNHSVEVNTVSGTLRASQAVRLSHIEPLLPDTFIRSHHSYIANLRYVKELDHELKLFTMQNGNKVFIRRQNLKKASDSYEKYLFHMAREGHI